MLNSITETLRKINIELRGGSFLSILLTFSILILFMLFKLYSSTAMANPDIVHYISSAQSRPISGSIEHFFYASRRGTKYYYYNCKSSIKDENKVYFKDKSSAEKARYTLSKTCK